MFSINNIKLSPNIIDLKNELGEMRKCGEPCIIRFYNVLKLKSPEEHYLRLLLWYMRWRNGNEFKQSNQSYKDRYKKVEGDILCNIERHELYSDLECEELQNLSSVQSDEEEDNAEFSMINPDVLDRNLESSDSVSNAPVVSTITDNLLLPNKQFYKICSQLNAGQQHLFNFIMQHALSEKLTKKNNELSPKLFQIFLSGGAGIRKGFLIKAITEYLK